MRGSIESRKQSIPGKIWGKIVISNFEKKFFEVVISMDLACPIVC